MGSTSKSVAAQANEYKDYLKCGNLSLIGDGKRTVKIVTNLGCDTVTTIMPLINLHLYMTSLYSSIL
jgi:hypothetical protein